ncbi:carbohydrate binding domain-containing protein [Streptomyces sp. NPDC001750]|uniref:carbohydrate binding domain-containing protein n=1 Tax=Streptomyces sp. NPDC001750 TaxID=3364607 RepID=UPI00369F1720
MAFPESPLGLRAELLLGGTWTDITKDVYTREPISITHGTASEGAQPDPASCSLLLNNEGGRYSPRNPLSPFYGLLGRNTPVRITVPGPESYLELDGTPGAYARTPAAAPLDITGDLDIRVEATTDWLAPGDRQLIGKWVSAPGARSYRMAVTDQVLYLWWSVTGSDSYYIRGALPALPPRAAVRGTIAYSGNTLTASLSWAASIEGPWTVLESASTTEYGTAIAVSVSPLEIASPSVLNSAGIAGRVHRAEVRSGIDGPLVAAPDFRNLAPGTTASTDAAGCAWTLGPAASVADREGLFAGEVSEWPPRWSPGGHDAWVPVQAAGILRRLGQGRRPLQSTLRRRIPSSPGLLAYWPMEDGAGATQLYSPLDGVPPLKVAGLELASDSSLGGSAPLPTLGAVASLTATVPRTSVQGWQVEMAYRLPEMPSIQTEILRVTVGGSAIRTVHAFASTAGIRIEARDVNGDTMAFATLTVSAAIADFSGIWNRLVVYVGDAGGGQTWVMCAWRNISTGVWWYVYTTVTGAMGQAAAVTGTWGSGTQGMAIGHLSVYTTPSTADRQPGTNTAAGADRGYARESTLDRLRRLAAEEPTLRLVTWTGDTTVGSEAMGPQGQDELMDLIAECAESDDGVLYERMDRLGLVYRDRATLYNQTPALVLDYASGDVAPPLEPVDDDAAVRNDVTVSREGGSSGRAVVEDGPLSVRPPEEGGVGVYEEAMTLSLGSDDQAQPIAAWRAHLGTWDEARYPTVRLLLHRRPGLIPAVLGLRPGDLVRIVNPPHFTGPGPLDLLVRQIQHQPRPRAWEVTLACTPAGPYRIGVVGDPVLGRADTDGSSLVSAVTATSTTLSVATPTGPVWVTAAPNVILDPQFEAGVGAWECTRGPAAGSVTREQTIVHSGTGAARVMMLGSGDTGSLNVVDGTLTPASPGQTWTASAWVYNGTSATAPAMRVGIVSRDDTGAETVQYGAAPGAARGSWTQRTVTATTPAGTVGVRLMVEGRAGFWTAAGDWWVMDDVRLARTDTHTGPDMPDEFPFEVQLGGEAVTVHGISGAASPQTFHVDRAVNGITKGHAAGTDVRLAVPTIVAL